jgi:phosphatidylinositol alpha 1,6-mannosyltransferase
MGVPSVHLWRRGVNSLLFEPAKRNEELRNNWGAPKKLIVGYVGRLANEKRISDLVGLSMDPTISLVIVGDGPAREKLERELPNAIFTGFRSGDDLASAYASFDLFIHPGPNETFCQTVQEALASGTPCIVPTTGGPSDLVTSGATGYIIPTDNPAVLSATVEHFRSRTDREEMRETARNSVATRTWSSVNRQLLKHYQEVIAEQRTATNVPSHNGHDGHEGKESAGNEGAVA